MRPSGRHAARHAAPRGQRRAAASTRPPWRSAAGLTSLAIAAATTTMALALEPAQDAPTVEFSTASATQSVELATATTQDNARFTEERAQLSSSRGEVREQIAAEAEAKAAEQKRQDQLRAEAEATEAALEVEAAQRDPQTAARILMPEFGFSGDEQWQCLQQLWMGESDWTWNAKNPSSGAYGIPQSLPAEKMAETGADWETNPVTQIRWGLNYIKLSYGTPCGAWEFWQAQDPHWY